MALDVFNFVNRCLACKRMNKGRLLHHPARSIKILELFEIVGMHCKN